MYIGLVRHFKVYCDTQVFMTSDDFKKWILRYDNSDINKKKIEIEHIKWDKCFSSDLPRAINTSKTIFIGEIVKSKLLREVPLSSIFKTNIKLPYIFWCISGRLAWNFHHKSQIESKKYTQIRVNEFLDSLNYETYNNILIVCHGFLMKVLQKELKKRGFSGQSIKNITGKLNFQ